MTFRQNFIIGVIFVALVIVVGWLIPVRGDEPFRGVPGWETTCNLTWADEDPMRGGVEQRPLWYFQATINQGFAFRDKIAAQRQRMASNHQQKLASMALYGWDGRKQNMEFAKQAIQSELTKQLNIGEPR